MHSRVHTCFSKSPLNPTNVVEIYATLLNYIWAKQNNGNFFIQIEDARCDESVGPQIFRIIKDLEWFGISSDGRPHLQSNKLNIYNEKLETLIAGQKVYRCFCSHEKPLYNRACLNLSSEQIKAKLAANQQFVWRLKVETPILPQLLGPSSKKLTFTPLTFSDFALTTKDGAFTKVFMNFVDNWMARITHRFVNSQDLTQTEQQAHLFDVFLLTKPRTYILPEIINTSGMPLSCNDFGFFVNDLKKTGYNPQTILNSLTQHSNKTLAELINVFSFKQLTSDGKIIFDTQKI